MDDDAADFREYLTSRPPGTRIQVMRAASWNRNSNCAQVRAPELQLYCDGDCNALTYSTGGSGPTGRLFGGRAADPASEIPTSLHPPPLPFDAVLRYCCEQCHRVVKSYSLRFWAVAGSPRGDTTTEVEKLDECPQFSPPTPAKVLNLVGPDRELFLKGRRAEIAGLGVGAFAYYRRIIEAQKNRLLDEVIRVARHLDTPDDVIKLLDDAKAETQFSRAVESVKSVIPQVLLIKGHNPLTLLHSALSQGLHDESDEACLQAASNIRLILAEFAGKLVEAMKEQRELDEALTRLVNRMK